MSANARLSAMAILGMTAVAFLAGPAIAGSDDVNPVFAPLNQVPRAALDQANGKGISNVTQSGSLIVNGVEPGPEGAAPAEEGGTVAALPTIAGEFTGSNTIAASAFSNSRVFAAIVQNNGSFVNIQNLMVVEVNMSP